MVMVVHIDSKEERMKKLRLSEALAFLGLLVLAGCESANTAMQSKRNQGAVVGGLLGAGTGAIIGNQSGHAGAGTAIGAGLGALAGGLVGNQMDKNKAEDPQAPQPIAQVKFCPIDGDNYPKTVVYCPVHGVALKDNLNQ